jgi:hypothetical protein
MKYADRDPSGMSTVVCSVLRAADTREDMGSAWVDTCRLIEVDAYAEVSAYLCVLFS